MLARLSLMVGIAFTSPKTFVATLTSSIPKACVVTIRMSKRLAGPLSVAVDTIVLRASHIFTLSAIELLLTVAFPGVVVACASWKVLATVALEKIFMSKQRPVSGSRVYFESEAITMSPSTVRTKEPLIAFTSPCLSITLPLVVAFGSIEYWAQSLSAIWPKPSVITVTPSISWVNIGGLVVVRD